MPVRSKPLYTSIEERDSKPLKVRDGGVGIPGDGSEDVFGDGGWKKCVGGVRSSCSILV